MMRIFLMLLVLFQSVAYAQNNKELNQKIEILAEEIERLKAGLVEQQDDNPRSSMKVYRLNKTGLSIGGYGEAYFTQYGSETEAGNNSNKEAKAEALRAIVYIGYKFSFDLGVLGLYMSVFDLPSQDFSSRPVCSDLRSTGE